MNQDEEKLTRTFAIRIGETLSLKLTALPREKKRTLIQRVRELLEKSVLL